MKLGGRFSAAIEVLDAIFSNHNSAAAALHDWGRSHRFAGSGDRSAIGNLVYDALRQKNSVAFKMGDDTPRALVLGVARFVWKLEIAEIQEATDDKFGPDDLTDAEKEIFAAAHDGKQPRWVAGDYPQWLDASFQWAFPDDAVEQGAALSRRAPVDLRVNTLKATRDEVLEALWKNMALKKALTFQTLCVSMRRKMQVAHQTLKLKLPTAKAGTKFKTPLHKSLQALPHQHQKM